VIVGEPAPALAGHTAKRDAFDLAAPRESAILIEFHRGTW
jgi:hypothetical protein